MEYFFKTLMSSQALCTKHQAKKNNKKKAWGCTMLCERNVSDGTEIDNLVYEIDTNN